MASTSPTAMPPSIPSWVPRAGVVFGAITILFLMSLVLLAVFGYEIPCNSRFLITLLISFSGALTAGFVGGTAAAKGSIPLLDAKKYVVEFSVGGGIAVLVILLLVTPYVYRSDPCDPKVTTCEEEIENLATYLKPDRLHLASNEFGSVRSCVEALVGVEERHKAAEKLISVIFSEVGSPPISRQLRNLRTNVIRLVREVRVTDFHTLIPDKKLDGLDLFHMDFSNTDLRGVRFRSSFLIETDFSGATLDGADFSGASIRNVNFENASLRNTFFDDADWFNALELDAEQLARADRSSLIACPNDTEGFHDVLRERYRYAFETWEQQIQEELVTTWNEYRMPGGICDQRDSWIGQTTEVGSRSNTSLE